MKKGDTGSDAQLNPGRHREGPLPYERGRMTERLVRSPRKKQDVRRERGWLEGKRRREKERPGRHAGGMWVALGDDDAVCIIRRATS